MHIILGIAISLCAPTAGAPPAAGALRLAIGATRAASFPERAINTPPLISPDSSSARACPPPLEGTGSEKQRRLRGDVAADIRARGDARARYDARRVRAATAIAAHARGRAARRAVREAADLTDRPVPGWWWWSKDCRLESRGGTSLLIIISLSPLRLGVEFVEVPFPEPDHMPTFLAALLGEWVTAQAKVRGWLARRWLARRLTAARRISREVRGWLVRRGLIPAPTLTDAVAAYARGPLARADLILVRVVGDASWVYCIRESRCVVADARAPCAIPVLVAPAHSDKASNARKARRRRLAADRTDRDQRQLRRQHRWDEEAVRLTEVGQQYFRAGRRAARLPLQRAINAALPVDGDSDGDSDADSRDMTRNAMDRLRRRAAAEHGGGLTPFRTSWRSLPPCDAVRVHVHADDADDWVTRMLDGVDDSYYDPDD